VRACVQRSFLRAPAQNLPQLRSNRRRSGGQSVPSIESWPTELFWKPRPDSCSGVIESGQSFQKSLCEGGETMFRPILVPDDKAKSGQCNPRADWASAAALPTRNVRASHHMSSTPIKQDLSWRARMSSHRIKRRVRNKLTGIWPGKNRGLARAESQCLSSDISRMRASDVNHNSLQTICVKRIFSRMFLVFFQDIHNRLRSSSQALAVATLSNRSILPGLAEPGASQQPANRSR